MKFLAICAENLSALEVVVSVVVVVVVPLVMSFCSVFLLPLGSSMTSSR
ncbi:MAG TPA: hypothetical protein VNK06_00135 [Thermodesulfobacteriota bacterium]|nr:hypothetical protein [Thermodesulfobacteriota bacterium]